jgi:glucan phosphoethanolaminetransferase (alkaline phosphatase superfamily)
MKTSQYIAGLIGPLFMAVAAFMVIRRDAFAQFAKAAMADRPLIFLAGVLLLVAGVAIVQAHNLWVRDWRVVVTILGWLAIAGGLMRIFVPEFATAIVEQIDPNHPAVTITAAIYFAFGAFLAGKAYGLF